MDSVKTEIAELVAWRHHLHQTPEIAFAEHDTAAFVADKLAGFGIEVHRAIGRTGVVGVIHGATNTSGAVIGLRADMDALPIHEQTNLPYASRHAGRMHACGHDGHTTMLLGAARRLAKNRNFDGTVICIFQPAEEGSNAGARAMLEDGLFDRFAIETVWGMHNWPGLPVGAAIAHRGPAMAGSDIFTVTIQGRGGHAAMPHHTHDPVVAAGMCIVALQSLVARQTDPFDQVVLSLTKLASGSAFNVIPASASISGTLRSMRAPTRARCLQQIEDIAKHAAATNGCTIEMEIHGGYPPTVNDPTCADFANDVAAQIFGDAAIASTAPPAMVAEDFAFMLEKKPGAYIWLGAGESSEKLHSPLFDFNDDLLPLGVDYWVRLAETKLPRG
jgi:hippurate hydrolase